MYKSITKSSYLKEGKKALRMAKKVEEKDVLQEKLTINQNSKESRNTCWTEMNKRYLDYEEGKIIKTPLVRLLDFRGEKLNNELMYYNYLQAEPTMKFVIKELIYPRLQSEKNFQLQREDITYFLNNHLDYAEATVKKTARSIVKALIDFGLINTEEEKIVAEYYEPTLIGFVYALYCEYGAGFEEAREFNILNPSVEHIRENSQFIQFFLIKQSLIDSMLQLCWKKEYLNYEPRGGLNQYVLKFEAVNKFTDYLLKGGDQS